MQEVVFLVNEKLNNLKAVDLLKKQGVSDEIIKRLSLVAFLSMTLF